jgi:hypothetical protein
LISVNHGPLAPERSRRRKGEFTFNDDIGGLCALALSLERAAKIVYDDTGAARGKERGIRLSKATLTNGSADVLCWSRGGPITSSAGDDDDLVIIAQFSAEIRHGRLCVSLPSCLVVVVW